MIQRIGSAEVALIVRDPEGAVRSALNAIWGTEALCPRRQSRLGIPVHHPTAMLNGGKITTASTDFGVDAAGVFEGEARKGCRIERDEEALRSVWDRARCDFVVGTAQVEGRLGAVFIGDAVSIVVEDSGEFRHLAHEHFTVGDDEQSVGVVKGLFTETRPLHLRGVRNGARCQDARAAS